MTFARRSSVGRGVGIVLVASVAVALVVSGFVALGSVPHRSPGVAANDATATAAPPAATHAGPAVRPLDAVYDVSVEEDGLPDNTTWFVSFNGGGFVPNVTSNGSGAIDFSIANGSYPYVVQANMWYSIANRTGTVTVNGTDVTVTVTFTALPTVPLVVRASGQLPGASWGINLGYPAISVVTTLGFLTFQVPNVTVPFNLTAPPAYGTAKVTGPTVPSQTSVNISGKSTLHVAFAPLETVYVNVTGLPVGAEWGVRLTSSLPHGGPPGVAGNTTGTSLNFTLVKGSWKFQLTDKPSSYLAHPGKGTIGVPGHSVTKVLKFTMISENVVFRRTGLASGTAWGVNVSGPFNASLTGTTATLHVRLPNGTYNWTAWNFATLHPHASTGSVTVVAPSATHVIVVAYTALPVAHVAGALPPGPTSTYLPAASGAVSAPGPRES